MTLRITTIVGSLLVLMVTAELVRRRHLREKYAVLWLLVSCAALVLAVFPGILGRVSELLGFQAPVNMFFTIVALLLLLVSMQLSLELGRVEARNGRLAEECALLDLRIQRCEEALKHADRPQADDSSAAE